MARRRSSSRRTRRRRRPRRSGRTPSASGPSDVTPSIVVGGEGLLPIGGGGGALVDPVAGGGGELDAHLGGGPFNCARTLGRLEQPVAYLGRISNDRFGVQLRGRLGEDGVALDCVAATAHPPT